MTCVRASSRIARRPVSGSNIAFAQDLRRLGQLRVRRQTRRQAADADRQVELREECASDRARRWRPRPSGTRSSADAGAACGRCSLHALAVRQQPRRGALVELDLDLDAGGESAPDSSDVEVRRRRATLISSGLRTARAIDAARRLLHLGVDADVGVHAAGARDRPGRRPRRRSNGSRTAGRSSVSSA